MMAWITVIAGLVVVRSIVTYAIIIMGMHLTAATVIMGFVFQGIRHIERNMCHLAVRPAYCQTDTGTCRDKKHDSKEDGNQLSAWVQSPSSDHIGLPLLASTRLRLSSFTIQRLHVAKAATIRALQNSAVATGRRNRKVLHRSL